MVRLTPGWLLVAAPGVVAATVALAGPLVVDDAATASRGRPFLPPGPGIPLGTDHLGRDVWSMVLDSGLTLIVLPLVATVIGTLIGASLGLLTGWRHGALGALAVRASELLLVVPPLLITVLALNAASGSGTAVLIVVVALLGVPSTMRFTRAATSAVVHRGYVEHAVAIGERTPTLLVREVLPTVAAPVLADAGLRLVGAIYVIASVSFLGLGGSALGHSWAGMVADNVVGVPLNPWAVVAPAVGIVAVVVSVNLVADRLADTARRSV
ncbi:ABC transporter permease [Phytoactinopolyspora halotolerans]|uniref:ABC transporter permease subunit n=1 Tax=Phytoactinopolyspora halotolerans TaxID=1981512 RepID=A0A6L9SDY6_9ACTN|nr:ABC transporter permease subunit [Phytoactinopolyspora halotolerans]NEE02722.1 ABC transporter permease subunit [Phytoactinopolyspora halotolerans]